MLTPADDFPLHQSADPIAFSGTDRNFYDRFFFNGYDPKSEIFFAIALGLYPQLNIMDASFCLSYKGVQTNLRARKEMNGDRLNLTVGPITIEIVKPLQETHIRVDDHEHHIHADLIAYARHTAIEEPRFTRRQGTRAFMDYTRATQNISWSGRIDCDGDVIDVAESFGTRDRSWGVRSVGMADPQPIVPAMAPQFYWLWTPFNFDGYSLFCHTNDDPLGKAWNRRAVLVDHETDIQYHYDQVMICPEYIPGTRRVDRLNVTLEGDGPSAHLHMEAGKRFYMQGLGYTHPEWGHGRHHGALHVACDQFTPDVAEEALASGQIHFLHVQAMSTATLKMGERSLNGHGAIEQLFIGPHEPSGFQEFLDGIVK